MLSESKIIINSLQKITKIKVLLEKLNDWLNNSYWIAETLFCNTIVKVIEKKTQSSTEKLSYLLDSFNSASNEFTQAIFENAMIWPSIRIIEKTETLITDFALEKLKKWLSNSEWEAEILFKQEIKYRENFDSINNILVS
jgi:hypothetical protein